MHLGPFVSLVAVMALLGGGIHYSVRTREGAAWRC